MYEKPIFMKKIAANVEGRDFVVGDIHGCFNQLMKLLEHVKFDENKDRLFSTGDLIDRGPDSEKCLELLEKNWFFSVLGNHEDLLVNKVEMIEKGQDESLSIDEKYYIKSLTKFIPQIKEIPLVLEVEHLLLNNFYIVHSEILPEHLNVYNDEQMGGKEYLRTFNAMKKYDFTQNIVNFFNNNKNGIIQYPLKQKMLWSRKIVTTFYKDNKEFIDKGDFSFMKTDQFEPKIKIFCGHNVVPFPMRIGQQYYIDTGAALGHSSKEATVLFSQFGHEFFALSMTEVTTGICYGCISSINGRNTIMKLEKSLY